MSKTFGFFTYGHTRKNPSVMRNSVILTNYAALKGCEAFCKKHGFSFVDLSPIIPESGIDWKGVGDAKVSTAGLHLDVLYCQASVSLEVINNILATNPECHVILQRDSTHAQEHLNLMKAAMKQHGFEYSHQYENNSNSLLNRELEEYNLANNIFVLSNWVKSTFVKHGLQDKVVHFTNQCSDKAVWYNRNFSWDTKPKGKFKAVFAGQLGLRKGAFTLLDGWSKFWSKNPNSELYVCGLPEHGIPKELKDQVNQALRNTPGLQYTGWVNMNHMVNLYRDCHVMVIPSVEEGSTMTGVEAAMCGTPIIATENAGIDLLQHEKTGLVVQAMDSEGLATALTRACNEPENMRRWSAAIQNMAQHSGIEQFSENCKNALENVIDV